MPNLRSSILLLAALSIGGAGCGKSQDATPVRDVDPAIVAALAEPITYDRDLTTMNHANRVAVIPSSDGSLPTIADSPQEVAAARAQADKLVGGAERMRSAPEAITVSGALPAGSDLTAISRAMAAPGFPRNCANVASYTMAWAGKMPPAFPVYPRGSVQEAAGGDATGCSFRSVNFQSPVPRREIIDFYFTRAIGAGFSTKRTVQDGYEILAGTNDQRMFAVYSRTMANGLVEVELVTAR